VLSGELGVSQAVLARWYIGGGHMDVSEAAHLAQYVQSNRQRDLVESLEYAPTL